MSLFSLFRFDRDKNMETTWSSVNTEAVKTISIDAMCPLKVYIYYFSVDLQHPLWKLIMILLKRKRKHY